MSAAGGIRIFLPWRKLWEWSLCHPERSPGLRRGKLRGVEGSFLVSSWRSSDFGLWPSLRMIKKIDCVIFFLPLYCKSYSGLGLEVMKFKARTSQAKRLGFAEKRSGERRV